MKHLLIAGLALGLMGSAAADTVDVLLKNTLTLTDAQGGVTTVVLGDEGKFEQTNAAGLWAAGVWKKQDGRLCMTARGQSETCMPLEADKDVGDSWEIKGPTGRVVWTATVVEGRADVGKKPGEDEHSGH